MFSKTERVYYEDTDAGGIVYHANYLKYMERSRCDWLAGLGFSVTDLIERDRVMFVVREASLTYEKPATLFDELTVVTRALQVGKVKLVAEQCIYTADDLLCRGEIKLATLHSDTQALIAMPEPLREALQQERVKAFTECA